MVKKKLCNENGMSIKCLRGPEEDSKRRESQNGMDPLVYWDRKA